MFVIVAGGGRTGTQLASLLLAQEHVCLLYTSGKTVQDLATVGPCIVAAVTRAGRGMLPTPDMRLQSGDMVHVSATVDGMAALRQKVC